MANLLSKPAENVAPRWIYQAILVEMTDKPLYGLHATQRHKEIRWISSGGVSPSAGWLLVDPYYEDLCPPPRWDGCLIRKIAFIKCVKVWMILLDILEYV